MRDAWPKFEAEGVRLFAISYDDQTVLREFAEKQEIPFPLLSDVDSEVIRSYGLLNDQIKPGDMFLYGIPYPGAFVLGGDGRVVAKFFHDSYKKRDSPELFLDAARGKILVDENTPIAQGGDEDGVELEVALHGGSGTLRQGIRREILVRFRLSDGLHVYGDPVPAGMVPVSIEIDGPDGLVIEPEIRQPTTPLLVEATRTELPVWSGEVDFRIPVFAVGELASEVRPLDQESVQVGVRVRYQACDERVCLLPRDESFELQIPLDVVDVPLLSMHLGHGQREGKFKAMPHALRLMRRKVLPHPIGALKFLLRNIRLELAARRRRS